MIMIMIIIIQSNGIVPRPRKECHLLSVRAVVEFNETLGIELLLKEFFINEMLIHIYLKRCQRF